MSNSARLRIARVTTALMLAVAATLSFGVSTGRGRAFSTTVSPNGNGGVLSVANTNDSGQGSLRQAVMDANAGDTIIFNLSPLPTTITLTSGEIDITKTVTITGPGASQLTISGNNSSAIFNIFDTAAVGIFGLTIANGRRQSPGGGIANSGLLQIVGCILSGNNAVGPGMNAGGAIGSFGELNVADCTFVGNSSVSSGAIYSNDGRCTVINSTFSGNSATIGGAGGMGLVGSANTILNCTISGNSAPFSGGGGGIYVSSLPSLTLVNTIIAGNTGGDCAGQGAMLGFDSHNLIQDGSCSPMLSGNPMLGPLQNNGGPTPTMALLAGSPAIDAGDDSVLGPPLSLTTDQRGPGFPRKSGLHVDIGAYEVQAPVGPSFDTCLKDNTTGNLLQWNSTTGQYQFTRCSDNFTLTGTGTVALVNGIRTINDFKTDRRISAGFNSGQLTGNATIYLKVAQGVWQSFRIIDTNPSAVCKC